MHRFLLLSVGVCLWSLGTASAQQTTATPIAPAVVVTDPSGNLLLVERRAASSIPGAAVGATGLVTRIVIVPPQSGSSPSTAVYSGTMSNFYLGRRALYTILTTREGGRTTRSVVAIDGGVSGALPPTWPSISITLSGSAEVRVVPATGSKDAIYIVQQPPAARRTTEATTATAAALSPGRTITVVEFDGVHFSTPRTVTVQ